MLGIVSKVPSQRKKKGPLFCKIIFIQSCNVTFYLYTTKVYCENLYIVQKVGSTKEKYTTTLRI